MKTKIIFSLCLAVLISIQFVSAQNRNAAPSNRNIAGNTCRVSNIQDLSPEQKEKIQNLQTTQMAGSTAHRAQMNELRAKKRSLSIADNPSQDEINSVIDQMAALQAAHMKSTAENCQSIRAILTPEQRVVFDAQRPQRKGEQINPNRRGRSQGMRRPR